MIQKTSKEILKGQCKRKKTETREQEKRQKGSKHIIQREMDVLRERERLHLWQITAFKSRFCDIHTIRHVGTNIFKVTESRRLEKLISKLIF